MKAPSGKNSYWLSRDGTDVQGPYSLPQIMQMHQADPFPAETPMRSDDAEEWHTVGHWIPSARPTPIPKEPHPTVLTEPPRSRIFIWLIVAALVALAVVYWLTAP